jgi:hypothetical protein
VSRAAFLERAKCLGCSRLGDERCDEIAIAIGGNRDVFAGGLDKDHAGGVPHRSFSFDQPGANRNNLCHHGQRLANCNAAAEADVELAAHAEPFARPGCGLDHRLIQHSGKQAAVNDSFEAHMGGGRSVITRHISRIGIYVQVQVQSMRIIVPTDQASARMR